MIKIHSVNAFGVVVILLNVIGPMRVTNAAGRNITPKGMRPKAILAALASAPDFTRSRAFLQDLLWSESDMRKGSASLRQTLTVIRRALGESGVLRCNDGFVGLETAMVHCDPRREAHEKLAAGFDLPEFAEGLDIADAVFEDWIRDERARYQTMLENTASHLRKGNPAGQGPIAFHVRQDESSDAADFSDIFMDLYFQGLSDLARLHFQEERSQSEADFRLRADTIGNGALQRLRSVLIHGNGNRNRWAASEILSQPSDEWDPALLRLAYRCHETSLQMATEQSVERPETYARTRAMTAFSRFLELSGDAFSEVDQSFAVAHNADPRGVYLAYRAFLRTNLIVERKASDPQGLAEEAGEFIRSALRDEPLNGAVNAAASHVSLLLDNNATAARYFATRATEINPANPLGWSSLANALVREERPKEALEASQRALNISRLSKFSYWWEMNASLVSAINQDPKSALEHAVAAHAKSPEFRPPLRYLIALYFHFGKIEAAAEAMDQLKQLEPDFEFRLFDEASYPTATLRQLPLRSVSKVSSF